MCMLRQCGAFIHSRDSRTQSRLPTLGHHLSFSSVNTSKKQFLLGELFLKNNISNFQASILSWRTAVHHSLSVFLRRELLPLPTAKMLGSQRALLADITGHFHPLHFRVLVSYSLPASLLVRGMLAV